MKIITGCNGFIGKKFAEQDEKYIGMEYWNCFQLLDNLPVWDRITEIIHMGAISSTTENNIGKPTIYNVEFSIRLFKKAIELGIPVKYASSASVYGNSTDGSINPLNFYAISKVQLNYWVQQHWTCSVRFKDLDSLMSMVMVRNQKVINVVLLSKFTEQAKLTGKIKIFEGSETMFRDFVCVDDVVDIVTNNKAGSGIFDLGSGTQHSFRDIAEIIAKNMGQRSK